MKEKKIFIYIFMAFIFVLALFMLFRSNTQSFKRLSASVSPEEEKNIIIEKAKVYINDNIEKFDGPSEISLKDLIVNEYLTKDEKEDVTKDLYSEETRIFFTVEKDEIVDIYLKDELFSKLFKCSDICYINENNYIYYNNDLYQIIKVDSSGSVYIVNNEFKQIEADNIEQSIRKQYNKLDKKLGDTVDLISQKDIENSEIISIEKDVIISSSSGYKLYSIDEKETGNITVSKADTMFIIKLSNKINYKLGDGTKFNPYIVSE